MKKRLIDLGSQSAILDIASYGRGSVRSFTPAQRAQIARTVGRVPEVMVKVSGGGRTLGGVGAHLAYIVRDDFEIETDMGERTQERSSEKALLEDWDLDIETRWHQSERAINEPRRSPKLVHNIIFSMPPGTDPRKVLQAVRQFAVNEWALEHRYAMVLHTNEAHPHVHVVVKARSEQGQRLNIRKATLRLWRDQSDQPWLGTAPLIQMERHPNKRDPYPLSIEEERLLFSELDGHLAKMALFKVNTGLREQEVVNLRWTWETPVPELDTSVFVIPRNLIKNGLDRYVVLNRVAKSVIDGCRGAHAEVVFTREGAPVTRIYNSGWKAARRRAAKPMGQRSDGRVRTGLGEFGSTTSSTPMDIDCAWPASGSRIARRSWAINPSTSPRTIRRRKSGLSSRHRIRFVLCGPAKVPHSPLCERGRA